MALHAPPAQDDVLDYEGYRARRYFPALDGVRAVAVLLVFTVHVGYQPFWATFAGGNGVTVFFVLSGLLITTLALREEAKRGSLDLKSFYTRRLFRIYPTYFAVLGLYCVLTYVVGLQPERRQAFTDQLPWYVFFVPEHGYFDKGGGLSAGPPFSGAWSIGIEEKFYLVWPLLGFVWLAGRLRGRLVALAVAAVGFAVAPLVHDFGDYLGPYLFITLGCVAGVLLHEPRAYARLRLLGRDCVLYGAFVGFAVMQLLVGLEVIRGRHVDVALGLLITAALAGTAMSTGRATGWLRARPMVFLGRISYVFYLLHNFCLNLVERTPLGASALLPSFAVAAVGLALSVLVSWVVHLVLERPMTRLGHRLARRPEPSSSSSAPKVPELGAGRAIDG